MLLIHLFIIEKYISELIAYLKVVVISISIVHMMIHFIIIATSYLSLFNSSRNFYILE